MSRLALFVALIGGCQTFRGHTVTNDAATKIKTEPATTAAVALPTKNQVRVSQYYFFADFDIKPDLPLFQELSDLREQVVRELHLPTSNTVIQVYLFEDREKYDRFMPTRVAISSTNGGASHCQTCSPPSVIDGNHKSTAPNEVTTARTAATTVLR